VPRAEAGTHERKMEKRKEVATANREFASAKRGGSPTEAVPETDMMGGGAEDDLEALRKERERDRRKKNEREIRREEVLRARAAEREERVQKYREKEEETMGWLKALARQRFG
jgi:peroxin-14